MKTSLNLRAVCIAVWSIVTAATADLDASHKKPGLDDTALLPAGVHRPFFVQAGESNAISVKSFRLDRLPVTNSDFLEFVRANARWQRAQVKRLFADENYLKHWAGDLELGPSVEGQQPVVWVSWFAAKAYAAWRGKRLPTITEWEYAAAASPTEPDGSKDLAFQRSLQRWCSKPSPPRFPRVGLGPANYWGIRDLHELVWEWTSDFNSALVSGDARGDTGLDRQLFCGAGSANSRDPSDFPSYMRYGFRSSLKAGYTVHNLGFRCASDL